MTTPDDTYVRDYAAGLIMDLGLPPEEAVRRAQRKYDKLQAAKVAAQQEIDRLKGRDKAWTPLTS